VGASRCPGPVGFAAVDSRLNQPHLPRLPSPGSEAGNRHRPPLRSAALPLQLAEQALCVDKVVVEDPAGDVEQVGHERVPHHVAHGRSFLARRDHVEIAKHGQLLRHHRLIERQRLLQFLDRPAATHEDFEHADPVRVRQGTEEAGLERLELTDVRRVTDAPASGCGHRFTIY
jgi:hypothetical protein